MISINSDQQTPTANIVIIVNIGNLAFSVLVGVIQNIQYKKFRAAPFGILGDKDMTKQKAIRLRTILSALFATDSRNDYCCAIEQGSQFNGEERCSLHIFSRSDSAAAYCDLSLLAHSLEGVLRDVLFIASTYDLGTTETKKVKSWMLF